MNRTSQGKQLFQTSDEQLKNCFNSYRIINESFDNSFSDTNEKLGVTSPMMRYF